MSGLQRRNFTFVALGILTGLVPIVLGVAPASHAEQASSPTYRIAAASIDAGGPHACVILTGGKVRCWGRNHYGELGYGNTSDIGDNETPASAGPVHLGKGRRAIALTAGQNHTCAILDNHTVRCWGRNNFGQLGYGNTRSIGDNEAPASAGPVHLGKSHTAIALTAGQNHTCAILDNHTVRCWGAGESGQLGYGNRRAIGDNETPASAGPVHLGRSRTAIAISAGSNHTCAILDDHSVRCWGAGADGRLGYGNRATIGDNETPAAAGPVHLGGGRTAIAVSAGAIHTCAVLDDHTIRCWGQNSDGRLGYGNTEDIGDDETPDAAGPVDLGDGHGAIAVTTSLYHTCAILDDHSVRCWGNNFAGLLGYGNTENVGDDETPGSVGPVDLGRAAIALAAGGAHTCAVLDDRTIRCWGDDSSGQLGYGNRVTVGDNETPASAGPVNLARPVRTFEQPRLVLDVTPNRDHKPAYRYVVKGKLTGRFVRDAATCNGTAVVVATTGKHGHRRVLATTTGRVRADCTVRARIAITQSMLHTTRSGVPIRIKVSYLGNTSLRPTTAHKRVLAR